MVKQPWKTRKKGSIKQKGKRFKVSGVSKVKGARRSKAIKPEFPKQVKLNEVHQTLLNQLSAGDKLWRYRYGVKQILLMDADTIRFHIRNENGIFNIDVRYDEGQDLYDIKGYKLSNHGIDVKTVYANPHAFVDQLFPAFDGIALK